MNKTFIYLLLVIASLLEVGAVDLKKQKYEDKEGDGGVPGPIKRFRHFNDIRNYPNGDVPKDGLINGYREKEKLNFKNLKKGHSLQSSSPEWSLIGPTNISGRVKSIVIHPSNPDIVYIGAAAGGIWKTTNGGEFWRPLFDFNPSIAMGALAIDENNPNILYAGTGEAVNGGGAIYSGTGMYKSTDAGETWKLIGLSDVGAFSKVFVHPQNSNLIVAGGTISGSGFYVSNDAGKTWERRSTDPITDISINPDNPNEYIIGVNGVGVKYSSDQGKTWVERNNGFNYRILSRISVQTYPSNFNQCVVLIEGVPNSATGNETHGEIWVSNNKGGEWFKILAGGTDFFRGQGFYDNYIMLNPKKVGDFYAGGIDVWKSNNGTNVNNITNVYSGGFVHPDQHCGAFYKKNPDIIYYGNDGGVYRSDDGGINMREVNGNLSITQFYAMTIDHTQKTMNYGGTQDNGTLASFNDLLWTNILGGDGFQTLVDPFNPKIVYAESQYGNMVRISYEGNQPTYTAIQSGLAPANSANAPFFAPIAVDILNEGRLYHGRRSVYYNDSRGLSEWIKLFPDRGAFCTTIAPANAESDLSVVWAGFANSEVWVTSDLENWEQVNLNGLPNRAISYIAASYTDAKTAYVTLSGYGTPHVYRTNDLGKTWVNISEDLPNVPFNAIAINPVNPNQIFAASDVGVFASYDDGKTWFIYGKNLPNSPVVDLVFHKDRSVIEKPMLRAATHGRSIWEVEVTNSIPTEVGILSPAGGEVYVGNTNQRVSWYGFDGKVKVELSLNNGETWSTVVEEALGNNLLAYLPNRVTFEAKIRISSISNPSITKESNLFTIKQKEKGSVLQENQVSFIPYGIAYDGNGFLWATDVGGTSQLYKLDANTLQVVDKIKVQGDSLFTDLAIDKSNGDFYIHRFLSLSEGSGGRLERYSKTGSRLRSIESPAGLYPIGVEVVDDKLVVANRDGAKKITILNKSNLTKIQEYSNPCNVNYGPRGLALGADGYYYHVCTYFPSGSLVDANVLKMNKDDFKVEAQFRLENFQGLINARGVDYDPRDKNIWISDYSGNIFKVAGFETISSVENEIQNNEDYELLILGNPIIEKSTIAINLKKKSSNVQLELYSSNGRLVGTFFDNYLDINNPKVIELKNDNYPMGAYYLVLKLDGLIVETKPISIIK